MQIDANMNIFLFHPDDTQIVFDCRISTRNRWVPWFEFVALREKALLARGEELGLKSLNDCHDELGHQNMAVTRMTANANILALERRDIRPCLNCAMAKARQKNVPRKR